jgi:hypothetical protein
MKQLLFILIISLLFISCTKDAGELPTPCKNFGWELLQDGKKDTTFFKKVCGNVLMEHMATYDTTYQIICPPSPDMGRWIFWN